MLGYGFRIQKSAFEANLSESIFNRLLQDLEKFHNEEDEDDSIRVYRLIGGREQITVIGNNENRKDDLEDVMFF